MKLIIALMALLGSCFTTNVHAQHESMNHGAPSAKASSIKQKSKIMDEKEHNMDMPTKGMYGSYPMTREASGTSWQPESTPMEGIHGMAGDWMTMTHGFIYGIYNKQEGDRGDNKLYSESMLMFMAHRPLNEGTIGFRSMISLDPLMGKDGYPVLLQTGETANGRSPLIDRQHPHDFLSELALTYSHPLGEKNSWFTYLGLPGEPALGPAAFPHRFPALFNPEAPLSHHWLDSTHITFGVATLGYVWDKTKLEVSSFRGREPDESRWDIESPKFDSVSGRLTYNPTPNWSMQMSGGHIDSPEQLEPNKDVNRYTASTTYNQPLEIGNWQTTLAWGRNRNYPGKSTDAFLLESALSIHKTHTIFGRGERVEKDELFEEGDPLHGTYIIHKATVGYVYDFPEWHKMQWGIGTSVGVSFLPNEIESAYGKNPMSYLGFVRVKL